MKRTILEISRKISIKSITYDNGTENVLHNEINQIIWCILSSILWSRYKSKTVISAFFPKKTNFDLISDEEIAIVENKVNNRPMKRLGWKTPRDVMLE